jgi:hypothetical protein
VRNSFLHIKFITNFFISLVAKNIFVTLFFFVLMFPSKHYAQGGIAATGDEMFCPASISEIDIVTSFSITGLGSIDSFSVQITTGYQVGLDLLILNGIHPTMNSNFNVAEGELTLTEIGPGLGISEVALIAAVNNIVFSTTATVATITPEKIFTLSVGDANYLALTDHFYEYIASPNISWSASRLAADGRNYYGLQGYLVTLTSQVENDFVRDRPGLSTGWIGANDATVEGDWKWVTGPEAGTSFWSGNQTGFIVGGEYNNWNIGEPNGGVTENYAHITNPAVGSPGTWNDLGDAGGNPPYYNSEGYIVEYGGLIGDPNLTLGATTRIYRPNVTPTFTAVPAICEGDALTALPTTSNNGVTGTWLPALDNTATTTYTFTPAATECAVPVDLVITVNQAPPEPATACYETATFNATSCLWVVTGSQPIEPTTALECWETRSFDNTTCTWVVTGSQPIEPITALECWETRSFDNTTCTWVVTGTQPIEPTTALECWDTRCFNDTA